MEKSEFLKLLPKLIREDDQVKGAIITALSGVVATKDDIARIIENSDRRFEAIDKRFEVLISQINIGFEQTRKEIKTVEDSLKKEIKAVDTSIKALGGRSGVSLEAAILELLSEQLIQENIPYKKMRKEFIVDKSGAVFTKNYSTDIDILVENGKTILIEVKYHPDNHDIFHFLKVAELYKRNYKPYDKLLLFALEIHARHLEYAREQGIKVITGTVLND